MDADFADPGERIESEIMICETCNFKLSAYLDGNLREFELRQVGKHLTNCRRCREDLRELQDLKRILRSLPDKEPREGFWDESLRSVRTRRAPARPAYKKLIGTATAAATIVAIAFTMRPHGEVPMH